MSRLTLRGLVLAALAPLFLGAAPAHAGPVFSDPYGVGAPDVLGSVADQDIRSLELVELSPTKLNVRLDLNYHGGDTTLAAFAAAGASYSAVPLGIGDVLIRGHSYLWAIPLTGSALGGPGGIYYAVGGPIAVGTPATRGTVLAGSLYRVDAWLSAAEVLGADPADDLRADVPVWGAITDPIPRYSGSQPLVQSLGGSELSILLQVRIGPDFYGDALGGFDVSFASTTCACDVIAATVPEPAPFALALSALALTALCARLCLPRRGGARGRALV